ncbi:fibroblast growth factor receptor 3 isoform X8, partial [Paramuricea clavata]
SVIARRSSADSSKIIIVVVVFLLLSVLVIFAVTLSFYRKRRITRQETFTRAVHVLHKGRSASKDNLGILFPDEKKDIECSPRRKLPSIREHNSMEEESEEGNIISYICVLDDWEIEKENLTILNKKLGGGYFGVVKKGMYKEKENDGLVVAVKMLKDSASAADRSDLLMELYILKEVNKSPHPNVIKLIGAFTSEGIWMTSCDIC